MTPDRSFPIPDDYVRTPPQLEETPEEFAIRFLENQSDAGLLADQEALHRGKILMHSLEGMLERGEIQEAQYKLANLVFPPKYVELWEPLVEAEIQKRGLA